MNLRELLEKATGEPWELGRLVKCDCGDGSTNCWHTFDEQVEIFPTGDELGPIAVASSEDRAALIVATHNCLNELLRVAEALEPFANYACELKDGETCDCHNCRAMSGDEKK